MTWRDSVQDWFSGYDPIAGAMLVAKQTGGEMTPGDCLRAGLLPAGWILAGAGHGGPLTNSVRMSDLMPDRIRRARASIDMFDRERLYADLQWSAAELQDLLTIARAG